MDSRMSEEQGGAKENAKRPARELILASAGDLFYREGFRAVGVDTITERSGVAKMTLYRHFPSKDDLIAAYLEESNAKFWAWFEASLAAAGNNPRAQLLAFFAALEQLVTSAQCHGCPFLNAVVDFPERDHPAHAVALAHKQAVRARFHDLAAQAGAAAPSALADQLFLLMDGAFMAIRTFGVDNPAAHVAAAAQALLAAHLPA
jgi:AcrR family transcriptional regulator